MTETPQSFTKKQAKIMARALAQLATVKSYRTITSLEDLQAVSLGHELQLSNHRMRLLSDHGFAQLETLVDVIDAADPFGGLADYWDIWSACRKTLEVLLSNEQMAESATEWFELVSARIEPLIQSRTFVVPFVGVALKDVDELMLGSVKLVHPSTGYFDGLGVNHQWADISKFIGAYRNRELWLQGDVRGTPSVAERRFRALADSVAGLLAVVAAAMMKAGAVNLFISPNMSGHDTRGDSAWFSWEHGADGFTVHRSGLRGVPFEIDAGLRQQLNEISTYAAAVRIFESEARSPLEEAVARGFHWFADAQRDPTPVMQFVKYWSCIETFFSIDQEEITKSVSIGVAAVLVFGGFQFVPRDEYATVKKRVAKLYGLRSKAVHRASRGHLTETDVGQLSNYAAQLLINMVAFVERGFQRLEDIKLHSMRLDDHMKGMDSVNLADHQPVADGRDVDAAAPAQPPTEPDAS
jgi:hypothetical protein